MLQVDRRTFLGFSTLATAGVLVDGWGSPLWAQDVRGLPLTKDVATTAGRVRGVVRFGINQFWGVPYSASTEGAVRSGNASRRTASNVSISAGNLSGLSRTMRGKRSA